MHRANIDHIGMMKTEHADPILPSSLSDRRTAKKC